MELLSLQVLVVVTWSFLGFQWLFHRGSPWVSQHLSKGFLRLSPTQRTEWNSRCQILSSKSMCFYIASLTKVGRFLFFSKGRLNSARPGCGTFLSLHIYLWWTYPERPSLVRIYRCNPLQMWWHNFLCNIVSVQTVQSELEHSKCEIHQPIICDYRGDATLVKLNVAITSGYLISGEWRVNDVINII